MSIKSGQLQSSSPIEYVAHALLALKGIVPVTSAIELGALSTGIIARVIPHDDPALSLFDRKGALAVMTMTGGALEHHPEFDTRFEAASRAGRDERRLLHHGSALLLVEKRGTLSDFSPAAIADSATYSICFDDHFTASRQISDHEIAGVLAALSMSCPQLIEVTVAGRALSVARADGARIYCYQIKMGNVTAYVSRELEAESRIDIARRYKAVASDASLQRVTNLLRLSFETDADRLRAFLASWNALEIFVRKVFGEYRQARTTESMSARFLRWLKRAPRPANEPIAECFEAIACALDATNAAADIAAFRKAKKHRDRLAHGQDVDETTLPVHDTRGLFRKYVALHVDARVAPA